MSSPSRLLKGRPTAPLPCHYGSNRFLDGSPQSCPTLQPGSPTSLKDYQERLNDLLMGIVRLTISVDPSQEDVFEAIEIAVKDLVNADRASLFLLDEHGQELHAQVFSVSKAERTDVSTVCLAQDHVSSCFEDYIRNLGKKPINIVAYRGKQVSLPITKGVVGYVASTGKLINVKDIAGSDHFCDDLDKLTGYKTKTLLCVPLVVDGKVMGVLEAVNKRDGLFSKMDECLMQSIALVCGVYLSHSHLKRECKRLQNKYEVAREMLQYHRQCSEHSLKELKLISPPKLQDYNIESFYCDTEQIPDDTKACLLVAMISDLVDHSLFDPDKLLKFALTVSKNYRPKPYHNWDHAFHVAQCMYCILKGTAAHFSDVEKFALVLAGLCHDLDHRAFNNGFLVSTNHPLSQLYSSSILENHHFSQTIELLQMEGLNVFSLLTEAQYQMTLEIIQRAILATDLVNFFTNKGELSIIVEEGSFSMTTPRHKELITCLMMTTCDLCCACKPWEIHIKSVQAIFLEFYAQGDVEKSKGLKTIEMMDRDYKHKLPNFQVGFIDGITEPCCKLLTTALPHIDILLHATMENKKRWQEIVDKKLDSPIIF